MGVYTSNIDVFQTIPKNGETANNKTLTCGAAGAKGAYTELIASTAKRVTALFLHVRSANVSQVFLVDIATGAVGSEVVNISNIQLNKASGSFDSVQYFFLPIDIASATRVAARASSSLATDTITIDVVFGEVA